MTLDECAKTLADGLTLQVKRGLVKDYVTIVDTEAAIKGRMDVSASLRDRSIYKRQMVCIYEEYTENCQLNRIVKAGSKLLISSPEVSEENKRRLVDLMFYFGTVKDISLRRMDWRINYGKHIDYKPMIEASRYAAKIILKKKK
jgi:5-methylcytosine-specific restriction enzyme subunit McrC